jgi:diguanylate cyclase (GGDEF)-like protein
LKRVSRTSDVPARIGGEEFALLLPGTDRDGAMQVAERLVQALEDARSDSEPAVRKLSASIGVAGRSDDESLDALLKRADHALYLAKRKGRARAEMAD